MAASESVDKKGGAEELGIDLLVKRLAEGVCREVIIATLATVEG